MLKKRITSTNLKLDVFNTDILSLANQAPGQVYFFESEAISSAIVDKFVSYAITENNRKEISKLIPHYCNSIALKHIDELMEIEYVNHEKLDVPHPKIEFYKKQSKPDTWISIECPFRNEIDVHASSFIKYISIPKVSKEDEAQKAKKTKS